jgi:PEP-CTERM motif-containing protein
MRRVLVLGCLVAVSLLRPALASADSLSFTGLGSGAWVNLKIGSSNETGWAGEINWNMSVSGVTKAITTYCGDLFDDAKLPTELGTYKTTAAVDADPTISHGALPQAGSAAAYLVNTYGASVHGNGIQSAALQIAIWQAMFGANSFTVLTTTANYTGIMNALSGFHLPGTSFTAVAGYFDVANGSATGSAANGQDQVVVGTPEPATIFLVGFAMLGMLGYQRRLRLRAVRAN